MQPLKFTMGGKIFLVDPWLAPKDGFGCFARLPESIPFKTPDSQKTFISMPICPLPTTVDEILADVDYYIVTHIHPDHIEYGDGRNSWEYVKQGNTRAGTEQRRCAGFCSVEI